jgi:hypothetical protein
MNKLFYYQIKGKENDSFNGNWAFPPLFSDVVEAKNKKEAKLLIDEEYGRKFPLRVLNKDLENNPFLLNIREVDQEKDQRTLNLFKYHKCIECETKFRIIDKYNDSQEYNKGSDFCTNKCSTTNRERNRTFDPTSNNKNKGSCFIYKITNKKTLLSYVGKTINPFTLRWYEHFYHGTGTKFHIAIQHSEITDWQFEVIEIVKTPKGFDQNDYNFERESYWINHFDVIDNGYNTLIPKKHKITKEKVA